MEYLERMGLDEWAEHMPNELSAVRNNVLPLHVP